MAEAVTQLALFSAHTQRNSPARTTEQTAYCHTGRFAVNSILSLIQSVESNNKYRPQASFEKYASVTLYISALAVQVFIA